MGQGFNGEKYKTSLFLTFREFTSPCPLKKKENIQGKLNKVQPKNIQLENSSMLQLDKKWEGERVMEKGVVRLQDGEIYKLANSGIVPLLNRFNKYLATATSHNPPTPPPYPRTRSPVQPCDACDESLRTQPSTVAGEGKSTSYVGHRLEQLDMRVRGLNVAKFVSRGRWRRNYSRSCRLCRDPGKRRRCRRRTRRCWSQFPPQL